MLAGRGVFGAGGESMGVAQSSIVAVWFKGKELAFALGLNLSIARLGSVINAAVVPSLYESHGLGYALGLGCVLCAFSILCAFGIACIDKKSEEEEKALPVLRTLIEFGSKLFLSDLVHACRELEAYATALALAPTADVSLTLRSVPAIA